MLGLFTAVTFYWVLWALPLALPGGVLSFVEPGSHPIDLATADLNSDGIFDYILVLEKEPKSGDDERKAPGRALLILLGKRDGGFDLSKRSDLAIPPKDCGGPFGDCYQGVVASKGGFTINEYGGSSWRWSVDITFRYSRLDRTWELARVNVDTFNVADPDRITKQSYRPPRDYGRIAIEEFDPDNYLQQGRK